MSSNDTSAIEPCSRDFLIGVEEKDRSNGNLLAYDLINLNCKLWLLSGRDTTKEDHTALAKHIVDTLQKGCAYTLPSNSTAAESFFKKNGRFIKKEGEGDAASWTEISDSEAVEHLSGLVQEELDSLDKSGYGKEGDPHAKSSESGEAESKTDETASDEAKETGSDKRLKTNSGEAVPSPAAMQPDKQVGGLVTTKPNVDDIVLIERKEGDGKMTYVDHAGNAFFILELSQFFTEQYSLSNAAAKGTRADAALATVYTLLGPVKDENKASDTYKARFLLRPPGSEIPKSKKHDAQETWQLLTYTEASEFALCLLFEKLVDKENIAATLENSAAAGAGKDSVDTSSPSNVPVKNFTAQDVLFGRGGLTNSHPGNRRFRDIILLHRPDYVRAIKVEKPNVARKIVKAIRCGNPPGRFLKKDAKNGMWYDTGDRHAAEKTSQALREKTQAEKAARSDEDKRKRLRGGQLAYLATQQAAAGMQPVLPLPANLSPADLQRMAQNPFLPARMGVAPVVGPFGVVMPNGLPGAAPKSTGAATKDGEKSAAGDKGQKEGGDGEESPPQEGVDAEGNILVTDSDVIAGRGGRSNHHPGNKRFRDIVSLHRPDYVRAAKIHKPAVARMIVRALRNSEPPGRFLKKDEKTGKWYDIGDKKAAEKASQALREKTQEERDRLKQDAVNGMPLSYFQNPALFNATSAMIKSAIPGLGPVTLPPVPGAAAVASAAAAAAAAGTAATSTGSNEDAKETEATNEADSEKKEAESTKDSEDEKTVEV